MRLRNGKAMNSPDRGASNSHASSRPSNKNGRKVSSVEKADSFCYRMLRWILKTMIHLSVVFLIVLLIVIPMLFKLFPHLSRHIVYLNAIKIPVHANLSDPSTVGLQHTKNFFMHVEEGVDIGVWHTLPQSLEREELADSDYDSLLNSGEPIILYCHGNTGSRATDHRVEMYQVLKSQNYHVISLDYRGFGDSSGSPTSEVGVMNDVLHLYSWLRSKVQDKVPVYIWGHSLGTGIATAAVRKLTDNDSALSPDGLILESPFTNIVEAATNHPLAAICKMFWWIKDIFMEAMEDMGVHMQSDEHILHIDIPILILHSEDDFVVPYKLGSKLYEVSKGRPATFPPVHFHTFTQDRGFLHKWICTASELPDIVRDFMAGNYTATAEPVIS